MAFVGDNDNTLAAYIIQEATQIEAQPPVNENAVIQRWNWPVIDPQFVLAELHNIAPADIGRNRRSFYGTYKNWMLLNQDQQNKTFIWVNQLNDTVREAVFNRAQLAALNSHQESTRREEVTKVNDRIRLMHLYAEPAAQANWYTALGSQTREQLDRQGNITEEAYNNLADKFNDYVNYKFENLLVQYRDNAPIVALGPRIAEQQMLFNVLYNLNPNEEGRAYRAGKWIEKQWSEIKSSIGKVAKKYLASGQHDGAEKFNSWLQFCETNHAPDHVKYAILLYDIATLDSIGRVLPTDVQRDTGALPNATDNTAAINLASPNTDNANTDNANRRRPLSTTPGAVNRRRQRARLREMSGNFSSNDDNVSQTQSESSQVHDLIHNAIVTSRQDSALQFIANPVNGFTPEDIVNAREQIRRLAFDI